MYNEVLIFNYCRFNIPWFANLTIIASNDINEETIWSLNDQKHSIDCFGIGTHLGKLEIMAIACVFVLWYDCSPINKSKGR